jgi:hypothetical protein
MAEQDVRVFYRIIAAETPGLSDFLPQSARGVQAPRTDDTELLFLWEHGVSVWNTQQQAIKRARAMPGRIGRYVVQVRIEADGPVRYLKTLGSGHFSLFGQAADMLDRVELPAQDAFTE